MSISDSNDSKVVLDTVTGGAAAIIENLEQPTDVCYERRAAVNINSVSAWEEKYMTKLPDDLKRFYLTTNGILYRWKVKTKDHYIPVGCLEINPLSTLTRICSTTTSSHHSEIPSLLDLVGIVQDRHNVSPHFDEQQKIFELVTCADQIGKVCLVYGSVRAGLTTSAPTVWLLDRSMCWSYLAPSLTVYMRMMSVHLGIFNWQYLFTEDGIDPLQMLWFRLLAPHCLQSSIDADSNSLRKTVEVHINILNKEFLLEGKRVKSKSSSHGDGRTKVKTKRHAAKE